MSRIQRPQECRGDAGVTRPAGGTVALAAGTAGVTATARRPAGWNTGSQASGMGGRVGKSEWDVCACAAAWPSDLETHLAAPGESSVSSSRRSAPVRSDAPNLHLIPDA